MPNGPPPRRPDIPLHLIGGRGNGMAVTTHDLATEAAAAVLRAGGNAVDAAVTANAVLGVVRPDTCGPGGDLFALVHAPGDAAPAALNASGRAGSNASAQALRDAGHDSISMRSAESITVPGCVDGWEALLDRFGSWTLATTLEPAIAAAADGFDVSPELADSLIRIAGFVQGQPSAEALYPDGAPARAGRRITRPDIAATLRDLADGGRDAFYCGDVGAAITEVTNGTIVAEDLTRRQIEWVDPIGTTVFGLHGWTIPPNSQGYLTLAAAWLAERIEGSFDAADPASHHALIESYRAVAWERDLLATDPDTAPLDAAELLTAERLDSRLARIRPDATTSWPSSRPAPGGTMYLCVRDSAGLGISLIQSNFHGIGTGIGAGATGVFLHARGAGFTLEPSHRNELVPGRRPLHTLSPTLWTSEGELRLLLGTRGGQYQPQLLLQVAAHHLGAGIDLPAAMALPRWIVDHWGPDQIHRVRAEDRLGHDVIAGLRERGHAVEATGSWQRGWGPVAAIAVENDTVEGAGDPRVSTSGAALI